jgi:hypothetical protein
LNACLSGRVRVVLIPSGSLFMVFNGMKKELATIVKVGMHHYHKTTSCHYILPLKSNFSGMELVPLDHTLTIMKGNMTIALFLLPKWNGTHAIPLYNDCSRKECDNATFYLPKWNGICAIPPYINTNRRQL